MKKQHFFLIALAILFIIAMVSCQKDYREKWVGDWDFVRIKYERYDDMERHDTIYYSGKITLGDAPDKLIINSATFWVEKDGFLSDFDWHGRFTGNNKVYIGTSLEHPHGEWSISISGTKK